VVDVRPAEPAAEGAPRAVFLLEAYVAPAASDRDPVGAILGAIRADESVHLLGSVVIPDDETMLCLLEAQSAEDVAAVAERVGRDAIRVVAVRWVPDRST